MTRNWTRVALVFSALWVFYVALFSQTILFFDSIGYEYLGRMLAQGHILEYYHSLNREPIYPAFVALNMKLADLLHLPYTNLILLMQGIILLLSQWMIAFALIRVGVSDKVIAGVILYYILSPSVLRSSLIVYSEIITYPLIIAVALVSARTWDYFMKEEYPWRVYAQRGLYTGLVFIPMVFVKGIFEIITPAFLIILAGASTIRWKMSSKSIKGAVIFFIVAYGVFDIPVLLYKTVNKIYNGDFAFTNRGSWAFYGTTARRVLPRTPKEQLAQMLYVFPDKTLCVQLTSPEDCEHWHYGLSDNLGQAQYTRLKAQNLSSTEIDRKLVSMSFNLMATHPIVTLEGIFWEGAKLFFWELPAWGSVALPRDLRMLYLAPGVYGTVIVLTNFLNFVFLIAAFVFLLFKRSLKDQPAGRLMFILILLLSLYIGAHSFFFLNERNALPIVPLYFILAGTCIKAWKC